MQSLLNSGVYKVAATGAETSKHGGATVPRVASESASRCQKLPPGWRLFSDILLLVDFWLASITVCWGMYHHLLLWWPLDIILFIYFCIFMWICKRSLCVKHIIKILYVSPLCVNIHDHPCVWIRVQTPHQSSGNTEQVFSSRRNLVLFYASVWICAWPTVTSEHWCITNPIQTLSADRTL